MLSVYRIYICAVYTPILNNVWAHPSVSAIWARIPPSVSLINCLALSMRALIRYAWTVYCVVYGIVYSIAHQHTCVLHTGFKWTKYTIQTLHMYYVLYSVQYTVYNKYTMHIHTEKRFVWSYRKIRYSKNIRGMCIAQHTMFVHMRHIRTACICAHVYKKNTHSVSALQCVHCACSPYRRPTPGGIHTVYLDMYLRINISCEGSYILGYDG